MVYKEKILNKIESVKIKESGIMDRSVIFVLNNQLKNREIWEKTVEVFGTREDSEKGRWRGEYFGKQMRGAALIYQYTKDEELYNILTDAVEQLLLKQDEYGRFSTYEVENEFSSWDMWCRKYVLVGMLYYADICKDGSLFQRIIDACKKHLDYILQKIGDGKGKLAITDTSAMWGCVNSCTILEPTVEIYKRTGEVRYLDFAKYIISTGGCKDCNLVELPFIDDKYPFEYPVTKAYEMMSFYEGLLAYYEATGEQKYFETVLRFVNKIKETDITIIGCSGCTHEFFDNSTIRQSEYYDGVMQETCVTVTWMRLNRRLFDITGDFKYIDNFEVSGFNALYGSLNTEMNQQFCSEKEEYMDGMAFDSYSPLYMASRGRGIGGFNEFASGGYNGCCIAIGACGVALMPLTSVMQNNECVYVNILFNGNAMVKDKQGKDVSIKFETLYPANGVAKIIIEDTCCLSLLLRKPNWCCRMVVDGNDVEDNYYLIDKNFNKGDCIDVVMEMQVKLHRLNNKIAFTYGPLTLATDEQKCDHPIQDKVDSSDSIPCNQLTAERGEIVRFNRKNSNGDNIILTDYQSCGKKWMSKNKLMTVWFNS